MIDLLITGRVGRDATVKQVGARFVINFSVCDSRKYVDIHGVEQEQVTWVDCSYWRNDGNKVGIAQYLKTGVRVWLRGQPSVRPYEHNGQHRASLDCRVTEIELQSYPDAQAKPAAPMPAAPGLPSPAAAPRPAPAPPAPAGTPGDDDDLPF